MIGYFISFQIYCKVAVMFSKVVEVIFDNIAFIAQANHKVFIAIVGIGFHDMPEDGFSSDFNHRLRNYIGNGA